MYDDLTFHPVASLIPEMDEAEFDELMRDIEEHGQREPIWLYEGQIIDGRHRFRACYFLGIEPKVQEWDGDGSLVSFVVSLNLKRRHLTASQKAAVAVDILPSLEEEARKREHAGKAISDPPEIFPQGSDDPREIFPQGSDDPRAIFPQGKASDIAGEAVGVTGRYVRAAKRIKEQAPDAFQLMREGRVTVPEAKELAALPEEVRRPAIVRAQEEPERKVTSIVRDAKKQQQEKVQGVAESMMAVIEEKDERVAQVKRATALGNRMGDLMECIRDLDPEEYVAAVNEMDRRFLASELFTIRQWCDRMEQHLGKPFRVLAGGQHHE